VWLSKRARDLLRIAGDADPQVEIAKGDATTVAVLPAIVDDLPEANEVDMCGADAKRLGRWALAYGKGMISMPMRIRVRRVPAGQARMSMLTRTLAAVSTGDDQLDVAPLQAERLNWIDRLRGRTSVQGIAGASVAIAYCALRWLLWMTECLLRMLFHAPQLAMRTQEAQLGDDTNRVIRIPAETFSVLGIKEGDEVFVQWANRRVIAVAHLAFNSVPGGTRAATVDTWATEIDAETAARHLVVGIAAEMRGELRIPRRTVVTVRRRVLSLFVQRINELTVPVGGLLLAALTIQGLSHMFVIVGIIIVTILAMLPARYRVPPRGRWP
jgi:antitoxin component of MazEF toxin-antitoxin module